MVLPLIAEVLLSGWHHLLVLLQLTLCLLQAGVRLIQRAGNLFVLPALKVRKGFECVVDGALRRRRSLGNRCFLLLRCVNNLIFDFV